MNIAAQKEYLILTILLGKFKTKTNDYETSNISIILCYITVICMQ